MALQDPTVSKKLYKKFLRGITAQKTAIKLSNLEYNQVTSLTKSNKVIVKLFKTCSYIIYRPIL